jgi:hypothetical protein
MSTLLVLEKGKRPRLWCTECSALRQLEAGIDRSAVNSQGFDLLDSRGDQLSICSSPKRGAKNPQN